MAAILSLGDFVAQIQARSKTGVVYAVTPNPGSATLGGPFTITRNGVAVMQFIWSGVGAAAWSQGANDANTNGILVEIITPDNVTSKADVAQLVNSLN
jgi:hypothetical protein